MNASQAKEYLTHVSWRDSKLGLERIEELLEKIDNPHKNLRYVHVAGTNGKGSVSAMLASVLTEAGYKTGLYTSPYINSFNERIQVDGLPISDTDLIRMTEMIRRQAEAMREHPTEFELVTAIAFQYFYECGCDIVVLEVGLGGRLDATNIIPIPEAAVIMSISLDHTAELGDTLEKIASEKAGIIKTGGDVMLYPQQTEVERVITGVCASRGARLHHVQTDKVKPGESSLGGQCFDYGEWKDLKLPLLGEYQLRNAAAVLGSICVLSEKGWNIGDSAIRKGLAAVRWPARFELVHKNPYVIVDGGHNPQCVSAVVENLNTYFPGRSVIFVTGVMADKDYEAMFSQIIPLARQVFTVTPDNPRALPAEQLAAYFQSRGVFAKSCESVEKGITAALDMVRDEEVICAFGSFYMAGTIRKMFGLS